MINKSISVIDKSNDSFDNKLESDIFCDSEMDILSETKLAE